MRDAHRGSSLASCRWPPTPHAPRLLWWLSLSFLVDGHHAAICVARSYCTSRGKVRLDETGKLSSCALLFCLHTKFCGLLLQHAQQRQALHNEDKRISSALFKFLLPLLQSSDSCFSSQPQFPSWSPNYTFTLPLEHERCRLVTDGASKCQSPNFVEILQAQSVGRIPEIINYFVEHTQT